ncbi:MAG: hypothetical protein ABI600_05790 [Luteolibacter sp.]
MSAERNRKGGETQHFQFFPYRTTIILSGNPNTHFSALFAQSLEDFNIAALMAEQLGAIQGSEYANS